MKFTLDGESIEDILDKKKKYNIPDYQRNYTWEKPLVKSFLNDIYDQIRIEENKLVATGYFIGTIILSSNITSENEYEIVDGQQRITTITILLSVISNILSKNKQELGKYIFENHISQKGNNIVNLNLINHEFQSILNPEKEYKVEDNHRYKNAIKKISDMYTYIGKELEFEKLKEQSIFEDIEYNKVLSGIYDQIKELKVATIIIDSPKDAAKIFMKLNSNNMPLTQSELIKSELLSSNDLGEEDRKKMKENFSNLNSELDQIKENFEDFIKYYFASKYSKIEKKDLFKKFKSEYEVNKYSDFLDELQNEYKNYKQICRPNDNHWKANNMYQVYHSLTYFNNVKIKQTRVILLSMLYLYSQSAKKIKSNDLKDAIYKLDIFITCCTIAKIRTNTFTNIFSDFAIKLRNSKSQIETKEILNKLFDELSDTLPTKEVFKSALTANIDKKKQGDNINISNILYKIAGYVNSVNLEGDGNSVEHIYNNNGKYKNSKVDEIGNLLIIEERINNGLAKVDFLEKIDNENGYNKSELTMVKDFITDHSENFKTAAEEFEKKNEDPTPINNAIGKRTEEIIDHFWNDIVTENIKKIGSLQLVGVDNLSYIKKSTFFGGSDVSLL